MARVSLYANKLGTHLLKGPVERQVTRILTPGTVTDEVFLQEDTNNYVMSIYKYAASYTIAFIEVSQGELYVAQP